MWVNAKIYRAFRQPVGVLSAHLGCGQKNYIDGWVNVDANCFTAKVDVWANLIDGVPFRDESLERVYSFHVVEHLPDYYLLRHFRELYRTLVPGGAVRVGGPDLHNACLKYLEGDLSWFGDFPDPHSSIGGKFVNFVFCRNEHLTALSESYLKEILHATGFVDVVQCGPSLSTSYGFGDVLRFEAESDLQVPHSVVVEARKPVCVP